MKKVILILLLLLVSACGTDASAKTLTDSQLNSIALMEVEYENNNFKNYYNYYTNDAVGKVSSNEISSVLSINGNHYIMNLKVNKIIDEEYYNTESVETYNLEKMIYKGEGTYKSFDFEYDYSYQVYELNEEDYLLLMDTEYLTFSAISDLDSMDEIAYEMLNTAKSAEVDEELVISEYSNKETIDYEKETIKLFEIRIPENGSLEDMIGTLPGDDFEDDLEDGYIQEDELRKEEIRELENSEEGIEDESEGES